METTATRPVEFTDRYITGLIRRIGIMTGGLSGYLDVSIEPGPGWAANVGTNKALMYDLGLAATLAKLERGEDAITGVIAHEIAHLRASDPPEFDDVDDADIPDAHRLANLVEDKRIEIVMSREFPGVGPKIDRLREGLRNPQMQELMERVLPHHQFVNAIYGRLWEQPVKPADADAAAAFARIEPLVAELLDRWQTMPTHPAERGYMTTNMLWRKLAPVWDEFLALRAAAPTPAAPQPSPFGDADPGDYAGQFGQSPDGQPQDADMPPADGSTDDDGTDTVPADFDSPGDVDADAGDPAEASAAGQGFDQGEASKGMNSGQIATLPEDIRGQLWDQLNDAIGSGVLTDEQEKLAAAVRDRIVQTEQDVERVSNDIQTLLDERDGVDDDRRLGIEDNVAAYNSLSEKDWENSYVMGRRFASVLRENRFDRWGGEGYESGRRVHERNIMQAHSGRRDVFKRKTRLRNRRYAIAILADASPSMYPSRIGHAVKATVMAAEALNTVDGIDVAVYAFGTDNAALKPFDKPLEVRRGKIGALASNRLFGGSTMMGRAVARVGRDVVKFAGEGDDTRKLLIVLTDGRPTDGEAQVKKVVAELKRKHGVESIGIGIGAEAGVTDALGVKSGGAAIFPSWTSIDTAAQLPAALGRALAENVRKAK